jgi:hypothetical protein
MPCPIEHTQDSKSIPIVPSDTLDPAIANVSCNLVSIGRILDGYGNDAGPLLNEHSALFIVSALHYLTNKAIAFVLRHEAIFTEPSSPQ